MKVLIIALDSLDYDRVVNGNFKHLKQKEYGGIKININPLTTPIIWASFLTGEQPHKHGVIKDRKWNNSFIEKIRELFIKLGLNRIKSLEKLGVHMLKLCGFKQNPIFAALSKNTAVIFDCAEKYIALNIPSYNEDRSRQEFKKEMFYCLENVEKREEIERKAWIAFESEKQQALELLRKNWNLFMVHFYLPDIIQHIFWFDNLKMNQLYDKMDETVKELKSYVNEENCLVLIVSDHGQKKGIHTPVGFYSSNKPLSKRPKEIFDFHNLISGYLYGYSREDIEKVKTHLKELGYI